MGTNKLGVDEGSASNIATNTITEDAVTKHIGRSVLNSSAGVELGTVLNPLIVMGNGDGSFTGIMTANLGAVDNAVIDEIASRASSINSKITACNTGDVTIGSSALPLGAATFAAQVSTNALLAGLGTVSNPFVVMGNGDGSFSGTMTVANPVSTVTANAGTGTFNCQTTILGTPTFSGNVTVANPVTTVTANLGATDNAVLDAIAASDASIDSKVTKCNTDNVTIGCEIPTGTRVIGAVKRDIVNYTKIRKAINLTGAQTDAIIWSPAGGKKWVLTDYMFVVSAAATVTFEDDLAAGDDFVFGGDFAANGGACQSLQTPLQSGEADADLILTTSAGNIKGFVSGYEA